MMPQDGYSGEQTEQGSQWTQISAPEALLHSAEGYYAREHKKDDEVLSEGVRQCSPSPDVYLESVVQKAL
jgi:hypothetical protein